MGSTLLSNREVTPEQREIVECLLAEVAVLEGDIAAGQELYRLVLERTPSSARALSGKGIIAANENRWSEARSYFERANTFRPQYDLALAGLALCAWQSGDTDGAFTRFQQALDANPENSRALLGLMQVGYPMKRFGEIEVAIKAYLDLHPADLEWVYCLAGCYYAQEKMDDAIEALNQITLFNPDDDRAKELRGMIDKHQSGSAVISACLSFLCRQIDWLRAVHGM